MAERQSAGGADPATRDEFGMQCTPPPRRQGERDSKAPGLAGHVVRSPDQAWCSSLPGGVQCRGGPRQELNAPGRVVPNKTRQDPTKHHQTIPKPDRTTRKHTKTIKKQPGPSRTPPKPSLKGVINCLGTPFPSKTVIERSWEGGTYQSQAEPHQSIPKPGRTTQKQTKTIQNQPGPHQNQT